MKRRLLLVTFLVTLLGCTPRPEPLKLEQPVPDFSLPNVDGTRVRLSDYRGGVILLNYWHLSCKPCLEEFPTFEELANEYSAQGLVVVAVHLGGPTDEVAAFIQKNGYTFTVLVDERMEVATRDALPTTYVIDREGMVRHRWIGGPLEREQILAELEPYW